MFMRGCITGIICFFSYCSLAQSEEILEREIELPKTKETTYELLNRITGITGFFFIYDSEIINSDKKINYPGGKHTVQQAINRIVQDKNIKIKVINRHILLYKKETSEYVFENQTQPVEKDSTTFIIAKAVVRDAQTKEPIPFVSASIVETGTGTISNQSGEFMFKIPVSDIINNIQISHIGYHQQTIPAELFINNTVDIYMQTKIVSLSDVIVGIVNPQKIIREMLNKIPDNYQNKPVYFTSYYREGIEKNNKIVSLSEAVFKIYKTGFEPYLNEQVKLLKMRKISNINENDSIILKMRAGIDASLHLDIIKYIPDFLELNDDNLFNYSKIDMAVTDSGLAHVIHFEQNPDIKEPLHKGELYIDANNSALLAAHFEVNPKYVDKAANVFVIKKPKGYDIKPEYASYYVFYKFWNGKYYLNHIRGDLIFKIKKKKGFFQPSKSVKTFFEMVVNKIDTTDVKKFTRKESIPVRNIFSETKFQYNNDFWEDFNIIAPEKELNEALGRISSKIEEEEE